MRTIVIGDIHGGLKGLKQLLNRVKMTDNDQLIFLGDYVDGWSDSAQVIQYLIELDKSQNCIFIKGNHDVWCEHWLRTSNPEQVWLQHGGTGAIESYQKYSENEKNLHLQFFENMILYYLDDQNRLFIHAGFTSKDGVEMESSESNFYYDRTLWEMAFTMDSRVQNNPDSIPSRIKNYQEIFIGHTPTLNFNSTEPMHAINVWNVDTGAAFYGKLSAIDVDSKQIYQSESLMELYPNEKGRNQFSLNEILKR